MKKWLLIDNYDSFTYNLVQLFNYAGILNIDVYRNDEILLKNCGNYDCIILSPGPNKPANTPLNSDIVKTYAGKIPILGICLGMQIICEAYGGKTIKSSFPVHGKASIINNNGKGLFRGLPSKIKVARYHSLVCSNFNNSLSIDAYTKDNLVMAVSHKKYPIYGVQFHPESFLTTNGIDIIRNFIKCSNL